MYWDNSGPTHLLLREEPFSVSTAMSEARPPDWRTRDKRAGQFLEGQKGKKNTYILPHHLFYKQVYNLVLMLYTLQSIAEVTKIKGYMY